MFKFVRKHSQPIGDHPLSDTPFLHIAWKYKPWQPIGDHPLWPCPLWILWVTSNLFCPPLTWMNDASLQQCKLKREVPQNLILRVSGYDLAGWTFCNMPYKHIVASFYMLFFGWLAVQICSLLDSLDIDGSNPKGHGGLEMGRDDSWPVLEVNCLDRIAGLVGERVDFQRYSTHNQRMFLQHDWGVVSGVSTFPGSWLQHHLSPAL